MESIQVTFPKHLPIQKVISILEGNLKENSNYKCKVEFEGSQNEENVFCIRTEDGPFAFYLIGITAAAIIEKYCI